MAVESKSMSVDQFVDIPDNPRQRDTERHAAKAMRRHLKRLSASHCCVAIAAVNGVPVCKLDGHTRAYLWKSGKLEKPDGLIASVFSVRSMEDAAELYTHFDNSDAAEGSVDKLSGACRESGLHLTSQLLGRHTFNTALKFAHDLRGACQASEYEIVPSWARAIKTVDDWQLQRNPFKGSGILALMLVAVASESFPLDTLQDFFTRYGKDMGVKSGKLRDGVQALKEHMDSRKISNQMTGYDNIFDMMSKGYSCMKAWCDNTFITNVQPSRDPLQKLHEKARKNVDTGRMELS